MEESSLKALLSLFWTISSINSTTFIVNFGDVDVGMFAPLESLQRMNQFCTLPKDMDVQQLKPRKSVNKRAHAGCI